MFCSSYRVCEKLNRYKIYNAILRYFFANSKITFVFIATDRVQIPDQNISLYIFLYRADALHLIEGETFTRLPILILLNFEYFSETLLTRFIDRFSLILDNNRHCRVSIQKQLETNKRLNIQNCFLREMSYVLN